METVIGKALEALLGYGVPGLAALGMIYIIYYLVKENRDLRVENKKLNEDWRADTRKYGEELLRANQDWSEFKDFQQEFLEKILSRRQR